MPRQRAPRSASAELSAGRERSRQSLERSRLEPHEEAVSSPSLCGSALQCPPLDVVALHCARVGFERLSGMGDTSLS